MDIAVGIDIGGTNTKIGLVTKQGELLDFKSFPTTQAPNFDAFTTQVKQTVDELLNHQNLDWSRVLGVGVGAPNGNSKNGFIENPPNLKHWGTVDLATPFKEKFNLPIFLENDANVAAIGEGLWGVAKDSKEFLVVTLGTGVGTGVVTNGQLIRGINGLAGEGGHIEVIENGRLCGCGGYGHLETYASVRGIKTTAHDMLGEDLSFKEISERYHAGDEGILKVFEQTAHHLGRGLAMMGCVLAPEYIVLAGGVATIGEVFAKQVEDVYNKHVYKPFKNLSKVVISTISTAEGAVLGAASLVFTFTSEN